jgi:TatD DNase family protein
MVAFGCYFTIGVEALYSDSIQAIAREIPDHLLLTETDNPGGLQWLKGEAGMPREIENVVATVAELRNATPAIITQTVRANFLHLIADDPWLHETRALLLNSQPATPY